MTKRPATKRKPLCPICRKETVHEWRPFCSKRCADTDLGNWASGAYAIPTNERVATPDDSED